MKRKFVPEIVLSKIIGFLLFLVLLAIANLLEPAFNSPSYNLFINFFNSNIFLLFIITIIFMIAEIFWVLFFPLNVPAPIFSAIGSILLTGFVFNAIDLLNKFSGNNVALISSSIKVIVYTIVFLLVLVFGYIGIFVKIFIPEELQDRDYWEEKKGRWRESRRERREERRSERRGERHKDWNRVESEVKDATEEFLARTRNAVDAFKEYKPAKETPKKEAKKQSRKSR